MKVARWAFIAVILANLALLAAAGPLKVTRLQYDVARRQRDLRALTLEQRDLRHQVAEARRHDRVMSRAGVFGLELNLIENESAAEEESRPVVSAPRQ